MLECPLKQSDGSQPRSSGAVENISRVSLLPAKSLRSWGWSLPRAPWCFTRKPGTHTPTVEQVSLVPRNRLTPLCRMPRVSALEKGDTGWGLLSGGSARAVAGKQPRGPSLKPRWGTQFLPRWQAPWDPCWPSRLHGQRIKGIQKS